MATVTRQNLGQLHDKLTIKLAKEDYLPQFDKAMKQYAKSANVPGFRKGMVPAGMVKKMYGQSVFSDEVLKTAGKQLEDYINSNKIGILGQPMIVPGEAPQRLDMNAPADVDFGFEIGLRPEFDIPALNGGTHLTRYKIALSDAIVDAEVKRMARRYGKLEHPDIIATDEDIVYATYQAADATGNILDGAEKKEDTVLMEKLPAAIRGQLMGKQKNDTILIHPSTQLTAEELPVFMKDSLKADISAAEHYYEMTITNIGRVEPRELDVMLFSEAFPNDMITSESGFRDKIREELAKEYDAVSNSRLQDEIYETLVHQTPMSLPVEFLKRWLREGGENRKTPGEVERDYPGYDHGLRWTLISEKIIRDNGLQVSRDEVIDSIKSRVLSYFGMETDEEAPWLDSYVQKMTKDEKAVNDTYQQLLVAKLFGFLQSKFQISEQELSEEEFFKQPNAHAAAHQHQH